MDGLSILGIIVGFSAILIGQGIEGGSLHSLFNPAAFLIVMGGTLGAVMLQTPYRTFKRALLILIWIIRPKKLSYEEISDRLLDLAKRTRQYGLISLEDMIEDEKNPIIKRGLELLVSGVDKVTIRQVLEDEADRIENFDIEAAKFYESMGGYSPTIGILGAVLGLIQVMQHLSDPNSLGAGIAVAFVATIYGVGLANLLFLPIANKLKSVVLRSRLFNEMIIEGMVAMASGESPYMITIKLGNYQRHLSNVKKKKAKA